MNTEDRNKPITQNETALEGGASPADLERTLRDEIERLRHEAQQKNQILQDRNDELVRVKAQLDELHERLNQLESSTSETDSTLTGEAERMRTEFQAHLALLQAELSQKEWALEDCQAKARGMEQDLRRDIESLRRQVAENETVERQAGRALVSDEPPSNPSQDLRLELAIDTAAVEPVSSFASHRRWDSGFGRKRRWRS
jgi:chromosome segregation ATPase